MPWAWDMPWVHGASMATAYVEMERLTKRVVRLLPLVLWRVLRLLPTPWCC
jgi:hypothetical protein